MPLIRPVPGLNINLSQSVVNTERDWVTLSKSE